MRPRRQSGASARPFNFTVRGHLTLMNAVAQNGRRQQWSTRWPVLLISGVLGLMYLFALPRLLALLMFGLFILSALVPRIRQIPYACLGVLALALLGSWSPFDITFTHALGGPKILRCCPGAPYRDLGAAQKRQRRGECALCSDLVGPNGLPHLYLVW